MSLKKCVAYQRKSNLCEVGAHFFYAEKQEGKSAPRPGEQISKNEIGFFLRKNKEDSRWQKVTK